MQILLFLQKDQFPDQKHGGQISLLDLGSFLGKLESYGKDLQIINITIVHFSTLEIHTSRKSS